MSTPLRCEAIVQHLTASPSQPNSSCSSEASIFTSLNTRAILISRTCPKPSLKTVPGPHILLSSVTPKRRTVRKMEAGGASSRDIPGTGFGSLLDSSAVPTSLCTQTVL